MGLFGKLLKTGLDVVTAPVAIVKDVATLGGLCTGEDESYTSKKVKQINRDVEKVGDAIEDL